MVQRTPSYRSNIDESDDDIEAKSAIDSEERRLEIFLKGIKLKLDVTKTTCKVRLDFSDSKDQTSINIWQIVERSHEGRKTASFVKYEPSKQQRWYLINDHEWIESVDPAMLKRFSKIRFNVNVNNWIRNTQLEFFI